MAGTHLPSRLFGLRRTPPETLSASRGRVPITRKTGCLPVGAPHADKYWPPVGRVDNVHGDRNLMCSCPPVDDYATPLGSKMNAASVHSCWSYVGAIQSTPPRGTIRP